MSESRNTNSSPGALPCSLPPPPFRAGPLNASPKRPGTSATFIGTSLVAITTFLPALMVPIVVVRWDAFDLAAHALIALWSILMMNIGLMGIVYRAEKRFMLRVSRLDCWRVFR